MTKSTEFASARLTTGQLNAMVKKLGGHDAVLKFLRGELAVPESIRSWREQDGVIYFSVISDGTTGPQWITRLEKKGSRVGCYGVDLLRSPDFKPTSGVTTEVAVLKGMLFENNDRITRKVRAEADKRKLEKPNAEVACLIREMFTDEELEAMGLESIVVMHESINTAGRSRLLAVDRHDNGRWLNARWDIPGFGWFLVDGLAFAVSKGSPQN